MPKPPKPPKHAKTSKTTNHHQKPQNLMEIKVRGKGVSQGGRLPKTSKNTKTSKINRNHKNHQTNQRLLKKHGREYL